MSQTFSAKGASSCERPAARSAPSEDPNSNKQDEESRGHKEEEKRRKRKARVAILHVDVIRQDFWDQRPWLLSGKSGETVEES
ncbi:MAG: hypothetical protein M1833_003639 [Piccolia ochrophora]|nr:MAG: hypothetical protein M1833_003639 [Piccolia ochrophora]